MTTNLNFAVTVESSHEGERLDKFLSLHPEVRTRTRAQKIIEDGLVTVNGKKAKASLLINSADVIHFSFPIAEPSKLELYDWPLDIIHEDSDVMVINKPAGLVVHPGAGHRQKTLVNALMALGRTLSMGFNEDRPGIVHRLDRDTSGLIVVAKNDRAHAHLAQQFKNKTTHRIYFAVIYGHPNKTSGTITSRLARHPKNRKRFASTKTDAGKIAVTHFSVLETHPSGLALVRLQLETGRTHQIRVHLSEMGHSIVGDTVYGNSSRANSIQNKELKSLAIGLPRFLLHAAELGFKSPSLGKKLLFKSDWPSDTKPIMTLLKWGKLK